MVESDLKTVEATLLRVTVGNLNSEESSSQYASAVYIYIYISLNLTLNLNIEPSQSHEGHLATILGELSAKLDVCFSYLDSIPRSTYGGLDW